MGSKLLAVGHILVDMRVRVNEMSGSDQFNEVRELSHGVGGSAANVAIGTKRLGGSCALMGKVGMDDFGRMVIDELLRERIPLDLVKVEVEDRTGYTIIIINRHGEVFMFGSKEASESLEPKEVEEVNIDRYQSIHIASLRIDTATTMARRACKKGIPVTFDPGRLLIQKGIQCLREIFPYLDLLLLNSKEASSLTGLERPEDSASALKKEGVRGVVVKLGEKGVYYSDETKQGLIPAFKVKAIDTTGAGDAFATGLIMSLADYEDLAEAIKFANAVAALKVMKLGSHAIPNRKQVEEFMAEARV